MNALIDKATKELESINNLSDMVGNRPHFPMFVLLSGKSEDCRNALFRKMSRVWPQTVSKIVFSSYEADGGFQLVSLDDGRKIDSDAMKLKLDGVKMARDTFAEMKMWSLYNIIDTSEVQTLDEFRALYASVEQMREIVIDNSRAMLIVLLDDSSLKRDLAKEIKAFLAKGTNEYDGIFIISNRTYNSEMYEMSELYSIAANVIVLSNNDAISAYDDNDYAARVSCLYNNHINTASYSLFERPNRKIVIQMIGTFLQHMQERANQNGFDISDGKKLGITDKAESCEEFLKKISYRFNLADMEYLPMRSGDSIADLRLTDMSCAQLKALTFDGVIEQFIENYYNTSILPEVNVAQFSAEYENEIKSRVFAPEGAKITEALTDDLFMKLESQQVNLNIPLATYIKEHMLLSIKRKVLYPACKEKIAKLKSDSEMTLLESQKLHNDFISSIPVDGFDDIGTMYETIVKSYIQSEKGKNDIESILRAGNKYEDMLEVIFFAVCNVVEANRDKFSLPFIEEWENRLNRTGEAIYKEIYNTLDASSKSNIHLCGNFPVEEKLQIYMLHTGDAKGLNKTELFTHLEQAYNGVNAAQFFNTGLDDSLEVLKIVDCGGEKLLW